jgi:hypothetical protein
MARDQGAHAESDESHPGPGGDILPNEEVQLAGEVRKAEAAVARVEGRREPDVALSFQLAAKNTKEAPRVRKAVDHHDVHGAS